MNVTRKVQYNMGKCFRDDYNNESMGHKSDEHLHLLPSHSPVFSVRINLFYSCSYLILVFIRFTSMFFVLFYYF